jgi:hypothetical protein
VLIRRGLLLVPRDPLLIGAVPVAHGAVPMLVRGVPVAHGAVPTLIGADPMAYGAVPTLVGAVSVAMLARKSPALLALRPASLVPSSSSVRLRRLGAVPMLVRGEMQFRAALRANLCVGAPFARWP